MEAVTARLGRLDDQQVLLLLDAVSGELAADDTPEGLANQAEALQVLFSQEGEPVSVDEAVEADPAAAADAARQLLALMAVVPDLQGSIEGWLDDPPTQEAAAIPVVLAAPVVLTACVAVLQLIGHVKFKRRSGQWEVSYDPSKPTPFDATLKDLVGVFGRIVAGMKPGE